MSTRTIETVQETALNIELIQRVDSAIRTNPHLIGNRVQCKEDQGIVVLHGQVSTFYQKQMAQEILKRLNGVERIVNQLEVDWRRSASI